MRDRSLDEFRDGADVDPSDEDGGSGEADAVDGHERTDEARRAGGDDPNVEPAIRRIAPDPAPAESTFAFSPEGDPCAACGARVERRWRDEAGLVCGDCKEW